LETAQLDAAVEFQVRTHPRGAVPDAFFQRAAGAFVNILDAEACLHRRDTLHRVGLPTVFRWAAVDDVGLVEVDVRLHQAATGGAAARRDTRPVRVQRWLDRDDGAGVHADIDCRCVGCRRQPYVADDQVHSAKTPPGEARCWRDGWGGAIPDQIRGPTQRDGS